MKILILGANSDIAKAAIDRLNKRHQIIALGRQRLDLEKSDSTELIHANLSHHDPDVVINCAGVFGDNSVAFDSIFNVNVRSNWAVISYYLDFSKRKAVKLIMLGSSSHRQGRKNFILYAASKSALYNMWQGASERLAEHSISIGLINPVRVKTKMVNHLPHDRLDLCLTADEVAVVIEDMVEHMTESKCVDMDYKKEEDK